MSFFFSKGAKQKPQFTGLQTQTSTSAVPVSLVYGRARIAPNIIWQGDFATHKQKQKTGKGFGAKGGSTYTYSASFQLALCWGPIVSVIKTWKDQSTESSYAKLGFTLFTGTTPQSPWGYLTTAHPTEALGYPGIAHLDVANYDIGGSNTLQQHNFEVKALLEGTASNGIDADPAQIINDFLTSAQHGANFTSTIIDQSSLISSGLAPTTGDSAFQTYCKAMGFGMSPALTSQQKASTILEQWAMICNTTLVWTGYSLKFHPWATRTITANGVTYLPDFPLRYSVDDRHFITNGSEDPVKMNRVDPADAINTISMTISNRANQYNDLPVAWSDLGLINQYGRRDGGGIDAKEICDPDMAAVMIALAGQRKAYQRNTFEFKLPTSFSLLEPMDIIELTDARFGVFQVLITDVSEDTNGEVSITAEEFNNAVSRTVANSTTPVSNTPVNTNVTPSPINPPFILEPPSSLSSKPQLWAAVSGGNGTTYDPNWGGCYVWLSTDNVSFNQIGEITTAARMGKLTANLAAYAGANPDTTHTLAVSLLMSNGSLIDAQSAGDAAAGSTLSYVQGEFVSFQTTALTGTNAYNLTQLYRGLYGSSPGAHVTGDKFIRLDDQIFKYDLPAKYIGVPLYIKFQSYNQFQGALEDLSTVAVYTVTPTGAAFGTGTAGAPSATAVPSTSSGAGFVRVTWTANSANDNVTGYDVYRATGSSQPFSSATLIGSVASPTTSYVDSTVVGATSYTYFIVAKNAVGSAAASAGANASPTVPGGSVALWNVVASGTGASQNIAIPYAVANANRGGIIVKVNGLVYPIADYSISGSTLTLTTNANADSIELMGLVSS